MSSAALSWLEVQLLLRRPRKSISFLCQTIRLLGLDLDCTYYSHGSPSCGNSYGTGESRCLSESSFQITQLRLSAVSHASLSDLVSVYVKTERHSASSTATGRSVGQLALQLVGQVAPLVLILCLIAIYMVSRLAAQLPARNSRRHAYSVRSSWPRFTKNSDETSPPKIRKMNWTILEFRGGL